MLFFNRFTHSPDFKHSRQEPADPHSCRWGQGVHTVWFGKMYSTALFTPRSNTYKKLSEMILKVKRLSARGKEFDLTKRLSSSLKGSLCALSPPRSLDIGCRNCRQVPQRSTAFYWWAENARGGPGRWFWRQNIPPPPSAPQKLILVT